MTTMGLVLTAAGLQQGFEWMNGTEWVDTVVRMKGYWLMRTLSGISMDIGMSLLVINLMMTALTRPAAVTAPIPGRGPTPLPAGGPAQGTGVFLPWWRGSSFFSSPAPPQAFYPSSNL